MQDSEDCISNEMSQEGRKEIQATLNLIENMFEVHGTWFYLPAVIRISELTFQSSEL